jgi:UDP-4-amino-4,6-dideoxy-N-acetyl-beta-L-altrosamine N-acetyltransferase
MKLTKYNVILNRLTEDKIEMVRNWRNDPKISQYMENREFITPEMQTTWFNKINNDNNYYFIIEFEGKEIGLINIKDIDHEKKEGEGGIFIYDDSYLNTDIPFRASQCQGEFFFETLKYQRITVHILRDNKQAIQYNKFLGFQKADNQEDVYNQLYFITSDEYFKRKKRLIKLLKF